MADDCAAGDCDPDDCDCDCDPEDCDPEDCDCDCDPVGGKSSGPLRPQPVSASTEAASSTTAHLGDKGLE